MKKLFTILVMLVALNASGQWVRMSNGISGRRVTCFTMLGSNIFAGTYYQGVFLTTNNGTSWTQTVLNTQWVISLAIKGSNIFAGTSGGVYLSTNNGTSWTNMAFNHWVNSIAISGSNIFAGTQAYGVWLSTNDGISWTQTALNNNITVNSLAISGSNIFAGIDYNGGVWLSTNNGTSWTQTALNNQTVNSIVISGINIFAGTDGGGVYLSTNSGTSWTQTALNNQSVTCLIIIGSNIFAGSYFNYNGVYLSSNNGISWTTINQGFDIDQAIYSLFIANNYVFAGTYANNGMFVWRRPLAEIIGIQNISTETPSKYSLSKNYPNPFNPTTNVKFSIIKAEQVKLIVYDIQGREVQTLVNESLKPGTYEVSFDGSQLTSGVYFYKLITDGFTETKKMILLK